MSSRSSSRRPNASLFVKGLNLSTTADDLKDLFTRYGPVQDVYLPLDYYTREPRGFSYVQFEDIRDAEDAFHYLDGTRLHGRELEIQYAEGDRKTPGQMRGKEHGGGGRHGGRGYDRRRSRSSSPRRRRRSYSPRKRSRSPRRSRSPYSPKKKTRRSRSRSNSRSPPSGGRSRSRSRSYSRSPSR